MSVIAAPVYNQPQDYFDDMLKLVRLRLDAYERSQRAVEGSDIRRAFARVKTMEQAMGDRIEASLGEDIVIGLEFAMKAFYLTDFERHCVVMALAPELDGSIGDWYAALQPGAQRMPSIDFCIKTFTTDAKLRSRLAEHRWDVLEEFFCLSHDSPAMCSDLDLLLKLDRRMHAFACDLESENLELKGVSDIEWPWDPLPNLIVGLDVPPLMTSFMKSIRSPRLLYVHGAVGCGRTLSVRYCCRDLRLPLIRVDMRMLVGRGEDYESSLRKIYRECRLRQSAVCFTHFEAVLADGKEAFRYSFVKMLRYGCPYIFILSEKDWKPEYSLRDYTFIEMEIPSPGTAERIALWNGMLEGIPVEPALSVNELAAKFSFTGGQIRGAIDKAVLLAVGEHKEYLDSELIHRACRNLISHKLGERATLIPIRYTWDDLILPPMQKNMLRRACDQIRFSHTVYGEWNFGEKIAYGRGVSMLLTGPPGTGKTMSAQIIAGVLQLEIYKVDLSAVVSKYIGETEKNLSDVFAEVKKSQSIL
ncbi:MAG: AAA family ATPase, partial [Peptococcaceae bacterium]|nr:AAA family ATPase [Peptococcaceae bacterium]